MAIIEDEFSLDIKQVTIFESLLQQENLTIELENDVSITYSGKKDDEITSKIKNLLMQYENDKNIDFNSILEQIELNKENNENDLNNENENDFNNENDEFKKNNLFSIKYKDIYIGGVSPNFQMREGFGLNKYNEDHTFYIGLWKNNMKEGFGFLKIDDDTYYLGHFHQNQFEGDCILYLKSKNIFYLGTFSNSSFEEGQYIDINNDVFYKGKFLNNRKNDDCCTMTEMNNRHIFIGEIENDNFKKGFLCQYICEVNESKDDVGEDVFEYIFDIEKIFHYSKDEENNTKFIYQFQNSFKQNLKKNIEKIFIFNYETKKRIIKKLNGYFDYLNTLGEDNDYNDLNKYNDKGYDSLFYIFMNNYNLYITDYQDLTERFSINQIKNELNLSQEDQEKKEE